MPVYTDMYAYGWCVCAVMQDRSVSRGLHCQILVCHYACMCHLSSVQCSAELKELKHIQDVVELVLCFHTPPHPRTHARVCARLHAHTHARTHMHARRDAWQPCTASCESGQRTRGRDVDAVQVCSASDTVERLVRGHV